MNGENTKDLTENEKLDLILAEITDVKARLSTLEALAEDRARETRPLFGKIQKEIADTRAEQADFRAEVADFRAEVKAEFAEVRDRFGKLEYRVKLVERGLGKLAGEKFEMETLQHDLEDRIIKLEERDQAA